MILDKLKELASKAQHFPWTLDDHGWVESCDSWNAQEFLHASSPATVLALIEVAEKARIAMQGANREHWDALRSALSRLEESKND